MVFRVFGWGGCLLLLFFCFFQKFIIFVKAMHGLLLIIVLSLLFLLPTDAKKASPKVIKEELPYIGCEVCNRVIGELHKYTAKHIADAGKKKLEEIKISETMDNICNPEDEIGYWIRHLDIVYDKSAKILALKDKDGISKCKEECVTIARSCETLLEDDIDRDDLSAFLYKNKLSVDALKEKACKSMSKRCGGKTKRWSAKAPKDYKFEEMTEKDIEMESMMAKMKVRNISIE